MTRRHPIATLFPYTTLFRSQEVGRAVALVRRQRRRIDVALTVGHDHLHAPGAGALALAGGARLVDERSEEHTSELQSHSDLVCRLLLEKKKIHKTDIVIEVY